MKSFVRIFVFAGLIGMASNAFAADKTAAAPKMSAEQEKQMAVMQERMTPGEEHKALVPLAGNWTYTSKFKMSAEDPGMESKGTARNTIIYDGRFLKQEITGEWMGKPFEGTGYIGYDKVKGEYVSIWLDSGMTGIPVESGKYDAATKTFKFTGKNSCPLTGDKERECKSEIVITDANHVTQVGYTTDPKTGKEFKAMEIVSTRA
jgi:hypothetical protein